MHKVWKASNRENKIMGDSAPVLPNLNPAPAKGADVRDADDEESPGRAVLFPSPIGALPVKA